MHLNQIHFIILIFIEIDEAKFYTMVSGGSDSDSNQAYTNNFNSHFP